MKKIKLVILFAILGLLYGCGTTTTDPTPSTTSVTVTIPSTAPAKAKIGDKISFSVAVTAPATLSRLQVLKGSATIDNLTIFTTSATTYNFNYTVLAADGGQTLTFKFIATDSKANTKSVDYTLQVDALPTLNESVRLLNQFAGTLASAGSFYSSADNKITNAAGSDVTKVDITYGVLGTTPSFVSPSARVANGLGVGTPVAITGWTTTTFAPSTLNFDTVTAAELLAATAPTSQVQTAAINGVYIFQNAAGKRGLIKVKNLILNGTAASYVDVVFDVKVIK
jgi:hypothetical protein